VRKQLKKLIVVLLVRYMSALSTERGMSPYSGLIDSGAVHTLIWRSTLDTIMSSLRMEKVDKCPPLTLVHRFGAHGTPIEPDFGVIIPWVARDIKENDHSVFFRADVLDGEHPLLIGCPTLVSMQAILDFHNINLKAFVNGNNCLLKLKRKCYHLFFENISKIIKIGDSTPRIDQNNKSTYYGTNDSSWTAFFQQPDLC
jgi:hypothetical protein